MKNEHCMVCGTPCEHKETHTSYCYCKKHDGDYQVEFEKEHFL